MILRQARKHTFSGIAVLRFFTIARSALGCILQPLCKVPLTLSQNSKESLPKSTSRELYCPSLRACQSSWILRSVRRTLGVNGLVSHRAKTSCRLAAALHVAGRADGSRRRLVAFGSEYHVPRVGYVLPFLVQFWMFAFPVVYLGSLVPAK